METQVRLGTLALCLLGLIFISRCSEGHAEQFYIEAGKARLTINEWARQSGRQVLFDFNVVGDVPTAKIAGEMGPYEALGKMIEGTILYFDVVNERVVAVVVGRNYCMPELGAEAPLPPCVPRPLTIHGR